MNAIGLFLHRMFVGIAPLHDKQVRMLAAEVGVHNADRPPPHTPLLTAQDQSCRQERRAAAGLHGARR